MPQFQSRRSCRVAMSIPIRIFAVDYRGVDFSEDAETIVINLHGAKIRTAHQLLPEQEIRILSHATGQEAVFRVVSRTEGTESRYTYWGVERLDQDINFWGVTLPDLEPADQAAVRVVLQCPACAERESIRLDEKLLSSLVDEDGILRRCPFCHRLGRWKILPFQMV